MIKNIINSYINDYLDSIETANINDVANDIRLSSDIANYYVNKDDKYARPDDIIKESVKPFNKANINNLHVYYVPYSSLLAVSLYIYYGNLKNLKDNIPGYAHDYDGFYYCVDKDHNLLNALVSNVKLMALIHYYSNEEVDDANPDIAHLLNVRHKHLMSNNTDDTIKKINHKLAEIAHEF